MTCVWGCTRRSALGCWGPTEQVSSHLPARILQSSLHCFLEGVIDHTMVPTQSANMLQSLRRAVLILESQSCMVECRQDNDSGDADRAHATIERRCPGGWAECA
jgi:hypothetical protein